jgi:NAD-reducing hydrogenase small subunit
MKRETEIAGNLRASASITPEKKNEAGRMPAARLRLATVWFGGCSGCHMSFLDLDEALIDLSEKIEIVFSPIVDTKEYPQDVDLVLIEGAVCNEEHIEMAHKIRQRTKHIVAFGDCATTGNVTAMRNQLGLGNAENVLQCAYCELSEVNKQIPQLKGIVPALVERVMPVHEVVHVDYFLPGCPPPAARIKSFLTQLLAGHTPELAGADLKFG